MKDNKKIGIISIHYGVNFGSALQAYALYKYIHDNVSDSCVEIINYIPQRFLLKERFQNRSSKKLLPTIKWIYRTLFFEIMNYKYRKFLKLNTEISSKIYDINTAKKRYSDYDYLIVGSDQVWNSDYNQGIDPMYYLEFANNKCKRISYAASCGKDDYNNTEWNLIVQYLNKFSYISLREQQDIQMFKEHSINNCEFVLDPTYLYDYKGWQTISKPIKCLSEKYLLIYLLDVEGKEIIEKAIAFAKKNNLKTVMISTGIVKNKYGLDFILNKLTPEQYINVFYNASFIMTNSFHGTSFSINFEKQFVVFKKDKYNKRIDNILNIFNLQNRCVNLDTDINKLKKIDYKSVNERKKALINKSKEFIKQAVNSI